MMSNAGVNTIADSVQRTRNRHFCIVVPLFVHLHLRMCMYRSISLFVDQRDQTRDRNISGLYLYYLAVY